jgi:predicted PurR-regulated permease PerM
LGFYWTLESERIIRNLLLWAPRNRREQIREFVSEAEEKVGRFILGQGALCLVIGVMAYIAYLIIGLPYALILALLAGIMEAVPVIGPALGAIPALMVALTYDPTKTLWVVLATIIIQGLENYLLVPRVMKKSVGINSIVVILSLAAFTSLLGLAGAILAIPIAAIVQLFINRFMVTKDGSEIESLEGRGHVSLLRYETQNLTRDIRNQLRENENLGISSEEFVENLESIAHNLDRVLALAEERELEN